MDFFDCFQHILRTRIHRLSALDDIVSADALENLRKTFSDRYGDKSIFLAWFFLLLFGFFFCLLLCRQTFGIFDQFLLMFFAHIVNLDAGQGTVGQCLLNRQTWIVCMNVNLDNIIICHNYQGVADRAQIIFQFLLCRLIRRFFCIDNKFRTITKTDICCLRASGTCCCFCRSISRYRRSNCRVDIHDFSF